MTRFARSPSISSTSDDEVAPREVAPFLRTLRELLTRESRDIIRWTMNGHAFEILDMDRLNQEVLPKYFNHNKYSSFQRQLNYFHFKKWTKSQVHVCTFSNQFFTRDDPNLSACITRKRPRRDSNAHEPVTPIVGLQDEEELLTKEDLEWLVYFDRCTDFAIDRITPFSNEWILEL